MKTVRKSVLIWYSPQEMFDAYKADAAGFSDDVYYMSPPIQLPCDSEAEPN